MPFSKAKIARTCDALNRLPAKTRDANPTPATDTPEDFGTPDATLRDYTDFFGFDLAGNRLLKLRGWDANGTGRFDDGETTGVRAAIHRARRAPAAKAQPTVKMRTSFHVKDCGENGCQERPRGFHVFDR